MPFRDLLINQTKIELGVCVYVCIGCCIYNFELVQVPYKRLKFL